jgi:tRNA 2-thiouridine synthesizing protein A
MRTMDYDEELDVCGAVCPVPAMKTVKQLGKMKPGQVLKVLVDYKPATEATPRYVAKTKHKFLEMEDDEDVDGWALYFEVVK